MAEKRKNPAFKYCAFLLIFTLSAVGYLWWYMDATILLTGEIPYEMQRSIFFMFQRDKEIQKIKYYVSRNQINIFLGQRNKLIFQNSFVVPNKMIFVIHTLLNLLLIFWKTQNNIPHYFFLNI